MRRYGPAPRTRENKRTAALLFIAQARDEVLLTLDVTQFLDRQGLSMRDDRRAVEAALLAAQAKVRRRLA